MLWEHEPQASVSIGLFQVLPNVYECFYKARSSHGKLKLANLRLVCLNGTKTVGKYVGKQLATNRTCLYSRQLFH